MYSSYKTNASFKKACIKRLNSYRMDFKQRERNINKNFFICVLKTNKVLCVWNDMRVSKWRQNFNFGVNYSKVYKSLFNSAQFILYIYIIPRKEREMARGSNLDA